MDVSIIIVNYNTTDLLLQCVDSIVTHTQGVSYEIIVVDNVSEKESLTPLRHDQIFPSGKETFPSVFRQYALMQIKNFVKFVLHIKH
ncbi:MAG: glycosyltransferase [Prevotella sp.]|nr:glycosyltransferase [Prevotella sp.]